MTRALIFTLLGFGLGALLVAGKRAELRVSPAGLRERAIEAQRISARASQHARDLRDAWLAKERKEPNPTQRDSLRYLHGDFQQAGW